MSRDTRLLLVAVGLAALALIFGAGMYYLVLDDSRVSAAKRFSDPAIMAGLPAPDGFRILYRRADELCILNRLDDTTRCLPTTQDTLLSSPPQLGQVRGVWSPDGQQVVLVSSGAADEGPSTLWLLDVAARRLSQLLDADLLPDEGIAHDQYPIWSPDSQRLAFVRTLTDPDDQPQTATLMVYHVTEKRLVEIMSLPGSPAVEGAPGVQALVWSPVGDWLALSLFHPADPVEDNDGLWLVNLTSGQAERILPLAAIDTTVREVYGAALDLPAGFFAILDASWSPDGRQLLVRSGQAPSQPEQAPLFLVDINTPTLKPLPLFVAEDIPPAAQINRPLAAFSANGSELFVAYFVDDVASSDQQPLDRQHESDLNAALWIVSTQGEERQFVGHLNLVWGPHVVWGDGDYLSLPNYLLTIDTEQISLFR